MPDLTLSPLADQVIVITGASSGIGLVTARLAAERGAAVVLAARNARDLEQAAESIIARGGRATWVETDVANRRDVDMLAGAAARAYGRIDTWVNNAGTSIYGRLAEVDLDDQRRLFDVNYWGAVHGSLAALPYLRDRRGGTTAAALINVGSVLSDRAIPLQGAYSASKHALKAFTDALRMELEEEGAPVSVSLVKPATIDTPFYEHARNYMEADPKPAPPVYAPEVAAEAILRCAEQPLRDVFAGASAVAISASGAHAKRVTDKLMERTMFRGQQYVDRGRTREEDNLFAPLDHDGGERGRYDGPVLEHSLAPALAGRGRISALSLMAAGIALYAGSRLLRGDQHAGTGAAGDDVAAGLTSADYGRAEYASAEAQLAVADSAEGAQHTPGSGQ